MGDQVRGWPNFRVLVPVFPGAQEPSFNSPLAHLPPQHRTMQFGTATRSGGGRGRNARWAFNPDGQVGSFTVVYGIAPNDSIPAGGFEIVIGDYRLRPWVDFTPVDGNDAATAAVMAAAINNLPGFEATVPAGALVVVTTKAQGANQVDFQLVNYTDFDFITGMSAADPHLVPVTPVLTAPDIT